MPSIPDTQQELEEWRESHPREKLTKLKLGSNTGDLDTTQIDWLRPLPFSASDEDIRHELREKGVVHVKNVLPREYVLGMRRNWFEAVAPSGVLKPGTDPVDGVFVGDNIDTDQFVGPDNAGYIDRSPEATPHIRLALESHTAPWAIEFAENPYLLKMVQRIEPTWSSPITLRRHLFRSNVPNSKSTSTGVHYDQIFLRGGPPTALTAWVPIGDCGPDCGGLMYLDNSVSLGEEMERQFDQMGIDKGMPMEERMKAFNSNMGRQGMLSVDAGDFAAKQGGGRKWLIGDYEAGDAVFHHSYMIHASGANRDPKGRIRLSADLRFADKAQAHDERWNQGPYFIGDGL